MILISSVAILPIRGATLGNIFSLLSPLVVIIFSKYQTTFRYAWILLFFLITFMLLCIFSQIGILSIGIPTFGQVILTDPTDKSIFLRTSLFSQSLYLFSGVLTFLFLYLFYQPKWDRFIFLGSIILASYGLYEIFYFQFFGENGDFLSNRIFGHGRNVHNRGTLFATINLGSFKLLRLKSLTGEPSMYAFTILPYWIYALHSRKFKTTLILFISLIFTISTTAYFGIIIYLILNLLIKQEITRISKITLATLFFVSIAVIIY